MNKVFLSGRLGKDPEIKTFDNGNSMAKFSLATSEKYKNKEGAMVENTEWHNIVAWGNIADFCGKYLEKGCIVNIFGKVTYRDYENKDGNKVYITEIVASEIKPITWKSKDGSGAGGESNNDLTF